MPTVLVTGAARGIGRSITIHLADRDMWRTADTAVTEAEAAMTAEEGSRGSDPAVS